MKEPNPYRIDHPYVLGIDESGTGAWAGPYVVGGVLFEKWCRPDGVTDCKKLRDATRRRLVPIIQASAVAYHCEVVEVSDIRRYGHRESWRRAISQTVFTLLESAHLRHTVVVIDGHPDILVHNDIKKCYKDMVVKFLPKADLTVPAVSAASILAKTKRNDLMIELGKKYPEYGFAYNAGYGTSEHAEALVNYGRSVHHRPLQVKWEVPERME